MLLRWFSETACRVDPALVRDPLKYTVESKTCMLAGDLEPALGFFWIAYAFWSTQPRTPARRAPYSDSGRLGGILARSEENSPVINA